MIRWIEDQILRWIQQRCDHPSQMVAADILEGDGRDVQVKYCRRCGAVAPKVAPAQLSGWTLPEPNLWRG